MSVDQLRTLPPSVVAPYIEAFNAKRSLPPVSQVCVVRQIGQCPDKNLTIPECHLCFFAKADHNAIKDVASEGITTIVKIPSSRKLITQIEGPGEMVLLFMNDGQPENAWNTPGTVGISVQSEA